MERNIVCTECGYSFSIISTDNLCFCPSCGTKILLVHDNDSKTLTKATEEFKRGRKKASGKSPDKRKDALNEISEISNAINRIDSLNKRVDVNNREMRDLSSSYDFYNSSVLKYGSAVLATIILIVVIIAAIDERDISIFINGLITVPLLICFRVFLIIQKKVVKKKIDKNRSDMDTLEWELSREKSKMNASSIPVKYRNREAVDYIYGVLKDKKALDIEQALQLYDEYSMLRVKNPNRSVEKVKASSSYNTYSGWDYDDYTDRAVREIVKGTLGGINEGTREVMKVTKTIIKDTWKDYRKQNHNRKHKKKK